MSKQTAVRPNSRRPYAARVPHDVRREQLLDAAMEIIGREGYRRITMDSIAREANVTRPVVYGVFTNLADLLGSLLDRQQGRALNQLFDALNVDSRELGPDDFIAVTVQRLMSQVTHDQATWRPILLAPQGTPSEVWVRIDQSRERVRERFATLLETYRPPLSESGLDPQIVSHALLAIAEHFGRLLLDRPDEIDADKLVATIQAILRRTGSAAQARPDS